MIFVIAVNLFGQETNFVDFEKEKNGLIDSYCERINVAIQENLQERVEFLDKTLSCFISSKSKKDIFDCKVNERRRILDFIKG